MVDRPSSIDKLPEEVRETVGRLRAQGRTIDEIMAHLRQMDVEVSRSAMGRHLKGMAAASERMRNSRNMAVALVERFGETTDNKLARLNLELMHGVVLTALTASAEDADGEAQPVTFGPEETMFLASALQKLASAEKTDADLRIKLKTEALKEAATAVEKAAKQAGLTRETVDTIRNAVLGVE